MVNWVDLLASLHFATCQSGMAKSCWMKHRPIYTLATIYQIMSPISIPLDTLGHKKITTDHQPTHPLGREPNVRSTLFR